MDEDVFMGGMREEVFRVALVSVEVGGRNDDEDVRVRLVAEMLPPGLCDGGTIPTSPAEAGSTAAPVTLPRIGPGATAALPIELLVGRACDELTGRLEEVVDGRLEEVVDGRLEEVVDVRLEEVVDDLMAFPCSWAMSCSSTGAPPILFFSGAAEI